MPHESQLLVRLAPSDNNPLLNVEALELVGYSLVTGDNGRPIERPRQ